MSIFVRGLNSYGFTSLEIMFLRSVIAGFFLFSVMLMKDKSLFKVRVKDLWMFACNGIVSLAFFSVCYFQTILECGASVAVVLLYTSPVFVLVLSAIFFKERVTIQKTAAVILTVAGCVLVAGFVGDSAARISGKGFLVGILSGLGYGLYSIFGSIALKKYRPLTVTFYTFVFAAVAMIPFARPEHLASSFCVQNVFLCLGVAIICTLLPYLLYTFGLSGLEAGKAAVFATVEPLAGTCVGIFLWKEDAGFLKLLGIALIFSAILLCSLKKTVRPKDMQ